jgi:hypothetical protein
MLCFKSGVFAMFHKGRFRAVPLNIADAPSLLLSSGANMAIEDHGGRGVRPGGAKGAGRGRHGGGADGHRHGGTADEGLQGGRLACRCCTALCRHWADVARCLSGLAPRC